MSLLKYTLRETPPDGYRWKCKQTGHRIVAVDKTSWLAAIFKFTSDNAIPLPPDWREQAEHELCLSLPPGFCRYADGGVPTEQVFDPRNPVEKIMAGTRVFLAFVQSGGKLVEPAVAEERGRTCSACIAAVPATGCGSCVGLSNLVLDIVGKGKTSSDDQLGTKQCAWCGCSALANVHVPVEVSQAGVTDAMLDAARQLDWCWKANEIRSLRGL